MKIQVSFPNQPERSPIELEGRDAWALCKLAAAGESGVTPIDTPGPRWSAYVHRLRRRAFNVETLRERHGPPYPGIHARYVLHTPVEIKQDRGA